MKATNLRCKGQLYQKEIASGTKNHMHVIPRFLRKDRFTGAPYTVI